MKIDWWTLALQTVNVVILIWLLQRFFWRPVAAMIAQRGSQAQQMLAEAEAKRTAATAALAEIAHTRAGFADERDAILAAAHKTAEAAHAARLSEAATAAAALQTAAKAQIEQDKTAAEQAWNERAGELAIEIATRLLAGRDGAALRTGFLDRLVQELRQLPESERQAVAANGATIDAISAELLDPAEQTRCTKAVADALQASPAITFKVDPALIAGLELRGPHFVVSNSWHADLDRIRLELAHDDRR